MQAAYDTTKARKIWQRSVESSDPDRLKKTETSIYRRKWEAVKQFELFFLDAYVGTIQATSTLTATHATYKDAREHTTLWCMTQSNNKSRQPNQRGRGDAQTIALNTTERHKERIITLQCMHSSCPGGYSLIQAINMGTCSSKRVRFFSHIGHKQDMVLALQSGNIGYVSQKKLPFHNYQEDRHQKPFITYVYGNCTSCKGHKQGIKFLARS